MADFDAAWMALGLFLLACGGVPAVAALVAEWRERLPRHHARTRPSGGLIMTLFHEDDRGAAPADLERIRDALTTQGWAPARPLVPS